MKNYSIAFPENYEKPILPGREEWCAALRSGNYKQGDCSFCDNEFYSALGVLLDVSNVPFQKFQETKIYQVGEKSCVACLPEKNQWNLPYFGSFPDGVEVLFEGEKMGDIEDCNDMGLSFAEIADIIESVWE